MADDNKPTELEVLKAENTQLKVDNKDLKKALAKANDDLKKFKDEHGHGENRAEDVADGKKAIYISHRGIDHQTESRNGVECKFITGSVNGEPFKVECNKTVLVKPEVYEALKPLLGIA